MASFAPVPGGFGGAAPRRGGAPRPFGGLVQARLRQIKARLASVAAKPVRRPAPKSMLLPPPVRLRRAQPPPPKPRRRDLGISQAGKNIPEPGVFQPRFVGLPPITSGRQVGERMKFPSVGALPGVGRPGDAQGFIHKKLLGVVSKVSGFIPGPIGTIAGTVARTLAGSRGTVRREATARPTLISAQEKNLGRGLKFGGVGGGAPCDFPKVLDSEGRCRRPTSGEFGGEQFGVGEAVMGRYGAALEPGSQIVDRAVCLKGMQLGDDGLCYNKSQITNKQRMWPAGRKPLLSGGDMRAIQIASRAGRRLEGATKRLQRLGMMKTPAARRARGKSTGKAMIIKEAGAGGVTVQ